MHKKLFLVAIAVLEFTCNAQASPTNLICGVTHSFRDNAPMDANSIVISPITNGVAKVTLQYKNIYTYDLVYTQASGNLSSTRSKSKTNEILDTNSKVFGSEINGYYIPIYDSFFEENILRCVLE